MHRMQYSPTERPRRSTSEPRRYTDTDRHNVPAAHRELSDRSCCSTGRSGTCLLMSHSASNTPPAANQPRPPEPHTRLRPLPRSTRLSGTETDRQAAQPSKQSWLCVAT